MHIKLKKDVHELWINRKESIGFSTKTHRPHSDFARHLLVNFGEDEPLKLSMESPGDGKYYIFVINMQLISLYFKTILYVHVIISFVYNTLDRPLPFVNINKKHAKHYRETHSLSCGLHYL